MIKEKNSTVNGCCNNVVTDVYMTDVHIILHHYVCSQLSAIKSAPKTFDKTKNDFNGITS